MSPLGRPPLDGLKRQLLRRREQRAGEARATHDNFVRETFTMERAAARQKAREWFKKYPKAAYWTQVESWRQLPDQRIEFTMRRLPTAD
ncbi:hypothetical protein LQ948_11675 [Jiella sp. MQZ9-1]|uniref:Uncharacterized protein n=1 Tax=Jiella flava TaxID=2816857 RepID=A0A939FWJ8_9HYPH|nr:hypothetical protein [Jiella flava]MBO0663293.1 hypothetical protein [Jiella flava]MCD2471869.1 hypothetical protein [Jiella flava]